MSEINILSARGPTERMTLNRFHPDRPSSVPRGKGPRSGSDFLRRRGPPSCCLDPNPEFIEDRGRVHGFLTSLFDAWNPPEHRLPLCS